MVALGFLVLWWWYLSEMAKLVSLSITCMCIFYLHCVSLLNSFHSNLLVFSLFQILWINWSPMLILRKELCAKGVALSGAKQNPLVEQAVWNLKRWTTEERILLGFICSCLFVEQRRRVWWSTTRIPFRNAVALKKLVLGQMQANQEGTLFQETGTPVTTTATTNAAVRYY